MAGRKSASVKFSYDAAKMRVVVLHGDDVFQIRARTREIADALREHFGEVEEFSYDGESAQLADVLDELRSYGLIQRHKLVILDNADAFLKEPKDGDESSSRTTSTRPAMERYAAAPVDHATLLMRARTWRAGKIDKLIAKIGGVFKLEAPTEARAATWLVSRAEKQYKAQLARDAADLMVAQIGPDLARLDVELGKLAAFVGEGRPISRAVVGEIVGYSREEQAWAIQDAIATGNPRAALEKLRELKPIDSTKVVLISWSIMDLMRKLHGASQLLEQGQQPFQINKQLKLWGDSAQVILGAARRLSPQAAADLLDRAVKMDRNNKSGVGNPQRSLEVLAMEIADTIGRGW